MPVTRKRKIEVARLAGFGLVLAGLFALFLAVMSAQHAGAEKAEPRNATLRCHHHSSDDGIGGAVAYGACDTTTTLGDQGEVTSTTWKHHCGCYTTTTLADQGEVTSTTWKHQCGCSTTTSSTTTTTLGGQGEVTSTTAKQPTTTTTTTVKHLVPTTTLGRQGGPPTAVTTAPQGNIPVDSGTPGPEATTGELPFTGASTFPLAGIGALMVVTGLALSVRRRRLAR